MSSNLDQVDIATLTKVSWDLYHAYYLVSGSAPDGFRQLVTELASLQGTLRVLRDHISSNPSFCDDLIENRRQTLRRCLGDCLHTLQLLEELFTKYRDSGVGDGSRIWQGIEWDTKQEQIEELKSRIMVHTANLHLYISSIGSPSPERLGLMLDPSGTGPSPRVRDTQSYSPLPAEMSKGPVSPGHSSVFQALGSAKPETINHHEPTHGTHPHGLTSLDSRFSTDPSGSISTLSINKAIPSSLLRTSTFSSPTTLETSFIERNSVSTSPWYSESIYKEYSTGPTNETQSESCRSLSQGGSIDSPISLATASALRQFYEIQLRDQHLRPLRYEPRDSLHQPDPIILERFESSSNDAGQILRLSTRDWLRVAVWWLLKARISLANCERPTLVSARGSMRPSTTSSNSTHQAYVDLLKASYILYDIVLKRQNPQSLTIDENRKLISDLSDGIKEDFTQFTSADIPDATIINLHNLDIWEPVQPEETSSSSQENPFILENVRYTTVELEDAGTEEERVILRTFVNAGIGGKKLRMRTKSAPYMLLLSTIDGESDPKITICNQSGTFCLQRDFTPDDLAQLVRVSNASLSGVPSAKLSEPVTLSFDTILVSVSFQYASDLGQFINIPKAYFEAVWQREPVDSEQFSESVIFKSSVELVEQLRAPIMKSMNPPIITRSCQVRILERTFGEVWRSIRRMVISSSLAEKAPMSLEFFMPMSRVQIHRGGDSRSMQLKWSDIGQERSDKTDGNYNTVFSYVYDDNSPNIGLAVRFRSEQRATEFEKAILSLSHKPTFSWSQPSSSGSVYDVADVALDQKRYKAILLLEDRLSFKFCSLYYLFRDTDYVYDSSSLHIKFPKLFYVDYISSHVDQLYRAANNAQVFFSHCEKKIGTTEAYFTDEFTLRAFTSSLAPGYELCFSCRADSMTTKKQSFLSSNKSTKGPTEVQLWRKGNSIRLASRWTNNIADRWLTMSVPSGSHSHSISRDANRIEFPATTYTRGTVLNLAVITSGTPKDSKMAKRSGPISISFAKAKDRDDFIAALDGDTRSQSSWKYGHGYDLLSS
ncbi:hypothetical protein BDW62DRAFT_177519 [Aspergillus aurantiobrunneus]